MTNPVSHLSNSADEAPTAVESAPVRRLRNPQYLIARLLLLVAAGVVLSLAIIRQVEKDGCYMDQTTYLLQAISLAHDFDLVYGPEDRARFLELGWGKEPLGLILRRTPTTYYFSKPFSYALVTAPFARLWPNKAPILINALLWIAMLEISFRWLSRSMPPIMASLFSVLCWGVTNIVFYVYVVQPDMMIIFSLGLMLYAGLAPVWKQPGDESPVAISRWRAVIVGLAAGITVYQKIPFIAFAFVVLFLWWRARRRRLATLATAVGAITFVLFSLEHYREDRHFSPYGGDRVSVLTADPFSEKFQPGSLLSTDTAGLFKADSYAKRFSLERLPLVLTTLGRTLEGMAYGRRTGMFPYLTPYVLLLIISIVGLRRKQNWPAALVLLAIGFYFAFYAIMFPHGYHGGATAIGNRYAAQVAPGILFAVGVASVTRPLTRFLLLVAFLAAFYFPGDILLSPYQAIKNNYRLALLPRFQSLPAEGDLMYLGVDHPKYKMDIAGGTQLFALSEPRFNTPDTGFWMESGARREYNVTRIGEVGEPLRIRLGSRNFHVTGRVESGDHITTFSLQPGTSVLLTPKLAGPYRCTPGGVSFFWSPFTIVVDEVPYGGQFKLRTTDEVLFVRAAQPIPDFPVRYPNGGYGFEPGHFYAEPWLLWGWQRWEGQNGILGKRWAGVHTSSAMVLPPIPGAKGAVVDGLVGQAAYKPMTAKAYAWHQDGKEYSLKTTPTTVTLTMPIPDREHSDIVLELKHQEVRQMALIRKNPKSDTRDLSALYPVFWISPLAAAPAPAASDAVTTATPAEAQPK